MIPQLSTLCHSAWQWQGHWQYNDCDNSSFFYVRFLSSYQGSYRVGETRVVQLYEYLSTDLCNSSFSSESVVLKEQLVRCSSLSDSKFFFAKQVHARHRQNWSITDSAAYYCIACLPFFSVWFIVMSTYAHVCASGAFFLSNTNEESSSPFFWHFLCTGSIRNHLTTLLGPSFPGPHRNQLHLPFSSQSRLHYQPTLSLHYVSMPDPAF